MCSHVWLSVGSGDPNSGPHTCISVTFPWGITYASFFLVWDVFCVPGVCNKPPHLMLQPVPASVRTLGHLPLSVAVKCVCCAKAARFAAGFHAVKRFEMTSFQFWKRGSPFKSSQFPQRKEVTQERGPQLLFSCRASLHSSF